MGRLPPETRDNIQQAILRELQDYRALHAEWMRKVVELERQGEKLQDLMTGIGDMIEVYINGPHPFDDPD